MAPFDIPRLASIWKVCLLLSTAHHSVATVWDNNNLAPLAGSHETASFSSNFAPPPSSGSSDKPISIFPSSGNAKPNEVNNDQGNEVALDLPINGNRGPEEPFFLSAGQGCRPKVDQAPHEHRRRIRREEGKACLSDYPNTSSGNDWNPPKNPSTSTPSEGSQDGSTGEAGAEGQALNKEPAMSQSLPVADPFRCPYLDRPIPACGSYIWARNAIPPYTLPSCTPINPLLDPPCISPMLLFCCQLVEFVHIAVLRTEVIWELSGRAWRLSAKNCILPGASQNWLNDVRLPPPGYSKNGF